MKKVNKTKPLNAGAQRAKDLAESRRAATAARTTNKRAASFRRAAVDAGVATKAEAIANARGARAARSAVRRAVGKVKVPSTPLPGRFKAVAAGAGLATAAYTALRSDKRASDQNKTAPLKPPTRQAPSRGSSPGTRGGARGGTANRVRTVTTGATASATVPTVKVNTVKPSVQRTSLAAAVPANAPAVRKADPAAAIAAFEAKLKAAGVVSIAGGKGGQAQMVGAPPVPKRKGPR